MLAFGISIPWAVSPMRVCGLEGKVLLPGFATYGETATHKAKCCPECGTHGKGDSCCHDLKQLPDSQEPSGPLVLPLLSLCDLNPAFVLPPCPVAEANEPFAPSVPIRGPDPPALRRALLEIWNI